MGVAKRGRPLRRREAKLGGEKEGIETGGAEKWGRVKPQFGGQVTRTSWDDRPLLQTGPRGPRPAASNKGVRPLKFLHRVLFFFSFLSPLLTLLSLGLLSPSFLLPAWELEGCGSRTRGREPTLRRTIARFPARGGSKTAGSTELGRSPRTTRPVVPRGHFRAPMIPCGVPEAEQSRHAARTEHPWRAALWPLCCPVSAPRARPKNPPRSAGQVQDRARGDPARRGSCGILRADRALPAVPPDGARPQVCVMHEEAAPSGVCVSAGS